MSVYWTYLQGLRIPFSISARDKFWGSLKKKKEKFQHFIGLCRLKYGVYDFVSNSRSCVNSQILTQAFLFCTIFLFTVQFGSVGYILFCRQQTFVKRHFRDSNDTNIGTVIDSLIFFYYIQAYSDIQTHTILSHNQNIV